MKVKLKSEFQKMKLVDPDEDPDPWMSKMELIKKRLQIMKSNICEEDLMLQILNNLPKEYETVIDLCEEELTKGALTLATLKTRIQTRFQHIVQVTVHRWFQFFNLLTCITCKVLSLLS